MLTFELERYNTKVVVSLPAERPNQVAPLQFAGNPSMIRAVRGYLDSAFGAFGHTMRSDSTTPIDLDHALKSPGAADFSPVLVEGADLVATYDPGIPEGAVT